MTKSRFLVSNETIGLSPATTRSRPKARRFASRATAGAAQSSVASRPPLRYAAYATLADLESGIAGGLGLLELSAHVLGIEVAVRYRDAIDQPERLSFAFGLGAVRAAALAGRFNALLISSPYSLGSDARAALATFELLAACKVAVFAGRCGWLDAEFERLYLRALFEGA